MAGVKETFKSFSQKKRPQLQRQFPFLREYQISNKLKKLWEQHQSGTRINKSKQLQSSACKMTRGGITTNHKSSFTSPWLKRLLTESPQSDKENSLFSASVSHSSSDNGCPHTRDYTLHNPSVLGSSFDPTTYSSRSFSIIENTSSDLLNTTVSTDSGIPYNVLSDETPGDLTPCHKVSFTETNRQSQRTLKDSPINSYLATSVLSYSQNYEENISLHPSIPALQPQNKSHQTFSRELHRLPCHCFDKTHSIELNGLKPSPFSPLMNTNTCGHHTPEEVTIKQPLYPYFDVNDSALSPDSLDYDCFRKQTEAILTKRSDINPKIVKNCESMFSRKARKRTRDCVIELNQSVDDVSIIETSVHSPLTKRSATIKSISFLPTRSTEHLSYRCSDRFSCSQCDTTCNKHFLNHSHQCCYDKHCSFTNKEGQMETTRYPHHNKITNNTTCTTAIATLDAPALHTSEVPNTVGQCTLIDIVDDTKPTESEIVSKDIDQLASGDIMCDMFQPLKTSQLRSIGSQSNSTCRLFKSSSNETASNFYTLFTNDKDIFL